MTRYAIMFIMHKEQQPKMCLDLCKTPLRRRGVIVIIMYRYSDTLTLFVVTMIPSLYL